MSASFNIDNIGVNVKAEVIEDNNPPPEPEPDGSIIVDGVKMFHKLKDGGVDWNLTGPKSKVGTFKVDAGSSPTTHPGYFSVKSREGGLASGGTQQTIRLHFIPKISDVPEGTWQQAKTRGFLATPNDIKNIEQTGFFRCRDVVQEVINKARITHKVRGGKHSDSAKSSAACVAAMLSWDEGRDELFEKELDHPDYDFPTVKKLFNIKRSQISNVWIGTKCISRVAVDKKSVKTELYINLDPFDNSLDKLNNQNWKKYFEYTDTGQDTGKYNTLVNWGGKITTWRINEVKNLDYCRLSVREIVGP